MLLTDSELSAQILDRLANEKLGKAALIPHDFVTMHAMPDRQLVPEGGIAWARFQVAGREFRGSLSTRNEKVARKRARAWRQRLDALEFLPEFNLTV